jgi:NodT family efflux transporter outer membrane factor (OMF) lipoprotein
VNESVESQDRVLARALAMSGSRGPARETVAHLRKAADPERRKTSLGRFLVRLALFAILFLLPGCSIGPRYVRPPVQSPPAYKELPQSVASGSDTWQTAQPSDGAVRGKWWKAFNDPQLDELEEKASSSNRQIAAAADNFLVARALVREARSQYFPTLTTNPAITRERPSTAQFGGLQTGGSSSSAISVRTYTDYSLPFDASWEPDFWGRIRNSVRASTYAAQASAADLENVRLEVQAELAVDYYDLRAQDSLKKLYDATVTAYQQSVDLTQSQYAAGLSSDEAVAQAEAQLKAAQAQDTNLGILRAQYEHAIAVLIGQSPSTFSLRADDREADLPAIPAGIPSQLLERRPDIASAERAVAQANAEIGVAKAAYFPSILLSATGGLGTSSISSWFTWPSRFWSVGPGVAETIFDAGLRKATVQQYRATYDQTVANYQQTVLIAFQQVEDNLASLRILCQDIDQQNAATEASARALQEATVRYKAGLDPYLNVIAAQTALLNDQQTAVTFRTERTVAEVQLIKALGGGWNASQVPSSKDVAKGQ